MPSPLTLFIGSLNREAPSFQGARGTGLSVYRFDEDAGTFAPLAEIRAACDRHGALLMVDDCHATGFVGPQGRGTPARR